MALTVAALVIAFIVFAKAQVRYPVPNDPTSYSEYDATTLQFVTRKCPLSQTFDSLSSQCIASGNNFQAVFQQSVVQQPQILGSTYNFVQIPGLDTICGPQSSVLYFSGAPVTCQNAATCTTQGGTCSGILPTTMTAYCCMPQAVSAAITVSSGYSATCANFGNQAYRNNQIWPCDTLADITECLRLPSGTCQRNPTEYRWYCCFQGTSGVSAPAAIGDAICQTFGYVVRENGTLAPCFNCTTRYGGYCLNNPADQLWYCCSWTRSYSYSIVQQAPVTNRVSGTCPDNTIGPACDISMQCQLGYICSNYVCCRYTPTFVQPVTTQRCMDGSIPVGTCGSTGGCNVGYNCESGFICCLNRSGITG